MSPIKNIRRYFRTDDPLPAQGDDVSEESRGKFTQWRRNGHAFAATQSTVAKLPPGVYRIEHVNDVLSFVPQSIVTDGLFEIEDSESKTVVNEIERFWTRGEVFAKLGFSFKRGWLLWGPHGSGKTSVVKLALRNIVDRGGLAVLSTGSNPRDITRALSELRTVEPTRPIIVVLEDIDAMIKEWDESDVLALLDGETSISHAAFIATTNYPEDLDGRVSDRPSRFDRVVEIGKPSLETRRRYISSVVSGQIETPTIENWAVMTDGLSIAHIKEAIVGVFAYEQTFEQAIDRVRKMKKKISSGSGGSGAGFGREEK